MKNIIKQLAKDFPKLSFEPGEKFCWEPSQGRIIYKPLKSREINLWSLLHELAHADLGHEDYKTDFELLLLESEAWEQARKLAKRYNTSIDEEHIQGCLDSYRDWLYVRSTCPVCSAAGLQKNSREYECFNCSQTWQVTHSRFSRPYRLKQNAA